jgi:trimethylamine:corrinoid methyltransferase-like protein
VTLQEINNMQVNRTNYTVNATPTFEVWTEEEIEAIYYAALEVLYQTGVRVYEPEGVELAYSGGAIVEDTTDDSSLVRTTDRVRIRRSPSIPIPTSAAAPPTRT